MRLCIPNTLVPNMWQNMQFSDDTNINTHPDNVGHDIDIYIGIRLGPPCARWSYKFNINFCSVLIMAANAELPWCEHAQFVRTYCFGRKYCLIPSVSQIFPQMRYHRVQDTKRHKTMLIPVPCFASMASANIVLFGHVIKYTSSTAHCRREELKNN